MIRLVFCFLTIVLPLTSTYAQNYREIDRYRDEFGDPIEKPDAYFAKNINVRNSYSYLLITYGVNRYGTSVITVGVVSTTGFAPERRDVSAPATLSLKTKDGNTHRFTSNDDTNGVIWFFGDKALQIGKLFGERNYDMVLTVKSYLDGSKSYRYSVGETTQGLGQTLREMADIVKRKYC